jgi:hypothetical protein
MKSSTRNLRANTLMQQEASTLVDDAGQPQPEIQPETRWPSVFAFVTAWLCPARSARRTGHVSLLSAFNIHLAATVLTFLLIVWLVAIDEKKTLSNLLADLLHELLWDWQEALLVFGLIALSIEAGFLLLAFLVMPWGAADEPLRSSFKHALRFTWLHTTHALPIVLLVGLMYLWVNDARRTYYQGNPWPRFQMPPTPTRPAQVARDSKEWQDYQAALKKHQEETKRIQEEYQRQWRLWWNNRPWLVKNGEAMVILGGCLAAAWFLWALLRAAGTPRRIASVDHPPTCEFCGYNLTGSAATGLCPECGRAVSESLGPDVRPGTTWEHRRQVGRLRAWWRCGLDAVLRPDRLGRQIRVRAQVQDHRSFLIAHLPPILLISAAGLIVWYILDRYMRSGPLNELDEVSMMSLFLGFVVALLTLGWAGLSAGVIGLIFSLRNRRNLLPAAMQAAAYLGAYQLAWVVFGAVLAITIYMLDQKRVFHDLARNLHVDHEAVAFFLWLLPNLILLGGHLILTWKATAAAQHANR